MIAHFRMSRVELFAKRRSKATVRRRHIAIYLSKILTIQSLPEIGMRFGGLDHTTILYASRKIERELPKDAELARDVAEIERTLAALNEARASSSRWFRLYDDAINDPKVLRLPEASRWQWVAMLCVASKHDGTLPQLADIALLLRMPTRKAAATLARLREAGLVDETDKGLVPHNWEGRQYKSDTSTERVRKHRAARRNVSADDDVTIQTSLALHGATAPETDTESEPDSSSLTRPMRDDDSADAICDPSIAERDYFTRGKALLGKNAGGLLAKLKAAKGGNVALARAALETASTKENPHEYIGAIVRGPREGGCQASHRIPAQTGGNQRCPSQPQEPCRTRRRQRSG